MQPLIFVKFDENHKVVFQYDNYKTALSEDMKQKNKELYQTLVYKFVKRKFREKKESLINA